MPWNVGRVPCGAGLLVAMLLAGGASAQTTTWQGGAGSWSDPALWDAGVPAQGSDVEIDGGNPVASDVAMNVDPVIHGLTVDAGDVLRLLNGRRLRFGGAGATLVNDGLVQHEGTGFTWIRLDAPLEIQGSGTIRLNGGSNAINGFSASGPPALTNGAGHTLEGAGSIGSGLHVINHGLLHANVASSALSVQSASGVVESTGVARASNAARLTLQAQVYQGGTYEADGAGSQVMFSNAEIHDAVLDGRNGGVVRVDAYNLGREVHLHDVTNLGRYDAPDTFLYGSFSNAGQVRLLNASTLSLESDLAITGGGEIQLLQNSNVAGPFELNNVDNALTGSGSVDVASVFGAASRLAPGAGSDPVDVIDFYGELAIAGIVGIDLAGVGVGGGAVSPGQVHTASPGSSIQFDQVNVYATATLEDALRIEVSSEGGFLPADGDFFDVLTADQIVLAGGLVVDASAIPGIAFDHAVQSLFDPTTGTVRDVLRLTARVPEPASLALLGAALGAAALRRRRGGSASTARRQARRNGARPA